MVPPAKDLTSKRRGFGDESPAIATALNGYILCLLKFSKCISQRSAGDAQHLGEFAFGWQPLSGREDSYLDAPKELLYGLLEGIPFARHPQKSVFGVNPCGGTVCRCHRLSMP